MMLSDALGISILVRRSTLPDDFPFRPPTLHVEPRIVSPIVSQDGRILPAAHSALVRELASSRLQPYCQDPLV